MFGDLKQESPWESYKLSELFDLTMGKTPSRDTPKYWSNGVYPWVSISDITSSNGVINDTKEKISEDAVAESGIKQIDAGTVLMSFKLSIGKTALTKFPLYTNEAIVAFVPKKSEVINNSFLQEWIKEKNWNEGSNKAVKGATLNKATLKEMRIHIPPIRLQNQFADFVGQVNKSKRTYKRIFESFDNLVKSRFIEMFGDPYLSPKYQKMPFMHCLDFNPGKSEVKNVPDDLMVSFVPMDSVGTDGSIDVSKEKTLGEVRKGYTYFRDNDVVFAKITPCFENGKVSIAKKCRNGIGFGTTEFHVARPKEGISNSTWLFYLLRSDSLRMLASGNMSGTAGQKRVQQPFFEKVSIGLPPINEQESFASFVKQVDKSKFVETIEPYHPAVFQNVHGFPSFGLIST